MALRHFTYLAMSLLCFDSLFAEDLRSLRKQYDEAKAKIGGQPKERLDKVHKTLTPILEQVGALDSAESLAFLVGELKTAAPEIAAACARPILMHTAENAPKALIQAFSDKNRVVASAILAAFAKTEHDLKPVEAELTRLAQGVQDLEVRKALPPVLARVDSVPAVKALLSHVQAAPKASKKGEDPQEAYNAAASAALKTLKSEDVKAWLAREAFKAAGSDPAKLMIVARAAGDLKLPDARPELEKLTKHPSPDVSTAAIASLGQVGIAGSPSDIASVLEKHKGKGDASFKIQALDSLAHSNTEEALEAVLKYSQGSDPEMRAIAMGSLALFKEKPRAVEGLCKGLEDSDASVRATSLRALATQRDKAMIGPLIEVLGHDKEQRLKVQAAELLARLTGQGQIGFEYEDWKKWWEVAQAKFEFPKEGGKGITTVRSQELSYFGIEVSSKRVGFLVDVSGSMLEMVPVREGAPEKAGGEEKEKVGGKTVARGVGPGGGGADPKVPVKNGKAQKIDVLKKELCSLIRRLPVDMQINIITFSGTFTAWQPQLQPMAGPGRQAAIKYVQELKTSHGTNVFDTLESALKDKRVDTIYLLTDGLPTAGRLTGVPEICKEIQTQNRARGVTIHCIAFGEKSALLEQLAKENGGQYRFVDSY